MRESRIMGKDRNTKPSPGPPKSCSAKVCAALQGMVLLALLYCVSASSTNHSDGESSWNGAVAASLRYNREQLGQHTEPIIDEMSLDQQLQPISRHVPLDQQSHTFSRQVSKDAMSFVVRTFYDSLESSFGLDDVPLAEFLSLDEERSDPKFEVSVTSESSSQTYLLRTRSLQSHSGDGLRNYLVVKSEYKPSSNSFTNADGLHHKLRHLTKKYTAQKPLQDLDYGSQAATQKTVDGTHHKGVIDKFEISSCNDKQELDRCLATVVSNQTLEGLPHTLSQLRQVCRAFKGGMRCVDRYTARCLPSHARQQLEENLTGARAFLAFLCDDSTFQKDYLSHGSCIRDVAQDWDSCHKHFKYLVALELERNTSINTDGGTRWKNICCLREKFLACVYHVGYYRCGRHDALFLKKVSATLSYSDSQRKQCQAVPSCSAASTFLPTATFLFIFVLLYNHFKSSRRTYHIPLNPYYIS